MRRALWIPEPADLVRADRSTGGFFPAGLLLGLLVDALGALGVVGFMGPGAFLRAGMSIPMLGVAGLVLLLARPAIDAIAGKGDRGRRITWAPLRPTSVWLARTAAMAALLLGSVLVLASTAARARRPRSTFAAYVASLPEVGHLPAPWLPDGDLRPPWRYETGRRAARRNRAKGRRPMLVTSAR